MSPGPDLGRVLVTGAAGRLGRAVTRHLLAHDRDVVATDLAPPTEDIDYPVQHADLRDHAEASRVVEGATSVVHLGNRPGLGPIPPQVVFNDNVSINANVFQAAAEQGVRRVVFASTLQLIGSWVDDRTVTTDPVAPRYPLDGSTTPQPSNLYALSKTVSETVLRYHAERTGLTGVALRFPLLHEGQDRVLVRTGEETATDVLEGFTGLRYSDAARAVRAVLDADLSGYRVYVPATSHRHRELALPELIRRFYPDVPDTLPDLVDRSTLEADTGWRPADGYFDHLSPTQEPPS